MAARRNFKSFASRSGLGHISDRNRLATYFPASGWRLRSVMSPGETRGRIVRRGESKRDLRRFYVSVCANRPCRGTVVLQMETCRRDKTTFFRRTDLRWVDTYFLIEVEASSSSSLTSAAVCVPKSDGATGFRFAAPRFDTARAFCLYVQYLSSVGNMSRGLERAVSIEATKIGSDRLRNFAKARITLRIQIRFKLDLGWIIIRPIRTKFTKLIFLYSDWSNLNPIRSVTRA